MQTIGERLEEARKKKGISIREAAEATKIRGDYLQRFENNQFDIGLTEIYTRGFLRTYANYLRLPADRILNDYAALGRGDLRPRQPNREVYGRMDISVATTENAERAAPAEEPAGEANPATRGPQRSRAATSLPSGPDPAVVFRYVKWGGVAIILILLGLVISALFTGRDTRPAAGGSANVAATGPTITLHAVRPVQVTISHKRQPNDEEGKPIYSGTMAAGESRVVPRPGALYIEGRPAENLDVEVNGQRFNLARAVGGPRGELPAP